MHIHIVATREPPSRLQNHVALGQARHDEDAIVTGEPTRLETEEERLFHVWVTSAYPKDIDLILEAERQVERGPYRHYRTGQLYYVLAPVYVVEFGEAAVWYDPKYKNGGLCPALRPVEHFYMEVSPGVPRFSPSSEVA